MIAFDPDPESLEDIEEASASNACISVLRADAMELPFPDGTFDSVVGTLVFCTIPDPRLALAETRRVMKTGAPIRLVEHVRGSNMIIGRVMDAATPCWMRIAGGCHLNRNTFEAVRDAGFIVKSVEEKWFGLFIGIDANK